MRRVCSPFATSLLVAIILAPVAVSRPVVTVQSLTKQGLPGQMTTGSTKAPAMQSGNSDSGTSGTIASDPAQRTQAESAAGNMQPQGQQGGAPLK